MNEIKLPSWFLNELDLDYSITPKNLPKHTIRYHVLFGGIRPQAYAQLLRYLALGRAGNTLALGAGLATSDFDAVPGPAGASARGTEDVNVGRTAGNSSLDVAQGQASDGDAAGGSASGAAVLVVLLNDDAVLGDSRQSDVLVGDALDGASRAVHSLNTDTWKF